MGGGGSKGSSQNQGQSSQITQVMLPQWVEQASQENYDYAKQVANRPYSPYPGTTVGYFSPTSEAAMDYINQNAGGYQGAYDAALQAQQGLLNWGGPRDVNAGRITAGQVGRGDVNEFMNPYIENVEKRAISNAERSGVLAQRDLEKAAQQAKAFGGSRQAIQQAVQGAETTRGIGDLSAQLRAQAYTEGQRAMEADYARQQQNMGRVLSADQSSLQAYMDAQKANQGADLTYADLMRQSAGGMADLAAKAQQGILTDYFALLDSGTRQDQKIAERLAEQYGRFTEERDYPLEQLNTRLAALGMSPYGRTEVTNKTESSSSKSQQSSGGDIGQGIMGGLSLMKGLMGLSDPSTKTDVQKLGKENGQTMYAFRYKGDPKSYPKVVGPMAPKNAPKVAGKRVIDLTRLRAA